MTITALDTKILEELAVAEYVGLESLNALYGRGGQMDASWVTKRLRVLRGERLVGEYRAYTGAEPVYYLLKAGLAQVDLDVDRREELRRRGRAASQLAGFTMEHNALRSAFRVQLLLLERQGRFTLTRWYHKDRNALVKGEYETPDGRVVAKPVNADAFFSVDDRFHFFLEVDRMTYAVRRSIFRQGSSVEKHLLLYESLLRERWRLEPYGIRYFQLVWLTRPTPKTHRHYAPRNIPGIRIRSVDRFDTVRALLVDERFREIRKAIRFVDAGALMFGEDIIAETFDGTSVPLIKLTMKE